MIRKSSSFLLGSTETGDVHLRYRPTSLTIAILFLTLVLAFRPELALAQSDPVPDASLTVPESLFIGEDFSFTVAFDNTGGTTGYGPYIDLFFPVLGADGGTSNPPDGIDFAGATYLGLPVVATELTFPSSPDDCVDHPYAVDNSGTAIEVCASDYGYAPGDKLVVLQLPFGSFTPDQPAAAITVNASLSDFADLGAPLDIKATAGFQYGETPIEDPSTDPSITSNPPPASETISPKLITIQKVYSFDEDETATGPNYPREYTVNVAIAPGQTVTNLDVTDLLPDNMQFMSVLSTSPSTSCGTQPSTTAPGGTLVCTFASVLGTGGADAVVTFQFHIPQFDANGAPVIDPASGDDVESENDASALGDWDPLDPRDPDDNIITDNAVANPPGPEHVLEDKSIAIQKGVTVVNDLAPEGASPGDTLEYSMVFQVSDFFAIQSLVISDTISDGQHVVKAFTPELSVNGNDFSLSAQDFNTANYNIDCNYTGATLLDECNSINPAANDGTTRLTFNLSDEMVTRGRPDGKMVGGCIPPGGTNPGDSSSTPDCNTYDDGQTTATVTFRTVILQEYTDDFPSGDPSVDQGDVLTNRVSVDGDVLNVWDLAPNGQREGDGSAAGVKIATGSLNKTIYAVNGEVCANQPCEDVIIAPEQLLTYRITYTIPSPDIEDLVFSDYLPLPIFEADELSTTFDATVDADAPLAGQAKFGPSDTFYTLSAIVPTIETDADANRVRFTYGDYDDPDQGGRVIDLLFTVTATDKPFTDRLFLTNQVRSVQGSTNGGELIIDDVAFVQVGQPVLTMRKGVIAAYNADSSPGGNAIFSSTPTVPGTTSINAPGSCNRIAGTVHSGNLGTTFNSSLSAVDAFDRVTYAIVVENSGTAVTGAYDVVITDTLPSGVTVSDVSNICVEYGDGTQPAYSGDLFGAGIELDDDDINGFPPPNLLGSLGPGQTQAGDIIESGRNLVIVTYDVILPQDVEPRDALVNTANIVQYAGGEGGPNHNTAGEDFNGTLQDTSSTTIIGPAIDKMITDTSQDHTTDPDVAVGEIITYTVTVTVPEGTSENVTLDDTLDSGLAFVKCVSVDPSSSTSLTTSIGLFAAACNDPVNPLVSSPGQSVSFNLGTVTNSDLTNATPETITFVYQAVVLNTAANNRGVDLNNLAVWTWTNGSVNDAAPDVNIVEPTLTVAKSATPTKADSGDIITFTLTVQNVSATDSTDAFNVVLSDTIPAGLNYEVSSLANIGGVAPTTSNVAGGVITLEWDVLADGASSIMRFRTKVAGEAVPGATITNKAAIDWTSLPGDITVAQSGYNDDSTERTGNTDNPGGAANDYRAEATADIEIEKPNPVKKIVGTSEPHTACCDGVAPVAIGEIVRFRMEIDVPETTSDSFKVKLDDAVPDGLQFINDGTAKVAFVANGAHITSTTISPANPTLPRVIGNEVNLGTITPTFVVPASAISPSAPLAGDGVDVIFDLGALKNGDDDADREYVVLEFNLLVDNVPANQAYDNATGADASTALTNTFDILVNDAALVTSSQAAVKVAEPVLSLSKTVLTTPSDAGDTLVYRLTYDNIGGDAAAFDIVLVDTLDSNLVVDSHSVVATGGACGATAQTTNSIDAGQTVTATVSCLNPGAPVTVDITATVASGTAIGQVIGNSADLSYTSLPGASGTPSTDTTSNLTGSDTPGTPGSGTGERTGQDGAGNLNDYVDSATAPNVTLAGPAISKALVSTSADHTTDPQVTIGEVITYALSITLPEGTATPLIVTDILPAGLVYVDGSVVVDTTGFNGSTSTPSVSPSGTINPGDDVVVTFSSVTVTADNVASNNSFVLRLRARVADVASNVGLPGDSTMVPNSATVQAGANSPVGSNTVNVSVVEPRMTISKVVTPEKAAANDLVTVTLTVANTGLSSAFDVVISDTVPAGMTYVPSPGVDCSTGAQDPDTCSEASGVITAAWTSTSFTTDGGNAIIRFQAKLKADAVKDQVISNTARVTQATTLPGTDASERDEPDVSSQDDVTVIAPDLVLSKDDGQADAKPGDRLIYDLVVTNVGERDATSVTITETVPEDTTFDAANSTSAWSCADGDPAGTVCTYILGELAGNNSSTSVQFAVLVDDPLVSTITQIANSASVVEDGTHGSDPTPDNNTAVDEDDVNRVGDFVWYDIDGDGLQDADEPGIGDVALELVRDGVVVDTTMTDASGVYTFYLDAGVTYSIRVAATEFEPGETLDGLPGSPQDTNAPVDDGIDSDADPNTHVIDNVTVGAGLNDTTFDFGFPPQGIIGDTVYLDTNGNGFQDPSEVGVVGVTVQLTPPLDIDLGNGLGQPITTVTTDGTTDVDGDGNPDPVGTYLFEGLPPGDYTVDVLTAGTALDDLLNTGDPNGGNDSSATATLTGASDQLLGLDFGYEPGSIGDTVFYDINGSGAQEAGEPGVSGVTVTLTPPTTVDLGNGLGQPVTAVTSDGTTDVDGDGNPDPAGSYVFQDLPLGDYVVDVDTTGTLNGLDNSADPNGPATGDSTSDVSLTAANKDRLDQDFGYRPQGAIGDTIFYDLDGDGLQDSGEAGVPSVTVQLTPPSGVDLGNGPGVPITTLSGSNGDYRFENLPPGDYTVTVLDPPAGTLSTADPDGGFDNTSVVTLDRADEQDLDQDFGYQPQGAIGDTIFYDIDASGVQDGSEVGIPGVTVQLFEIDGVTPVLDSNGNPVTDVTDGDGIYGFEHLLAGNYVVKVDEGSLPEPLPQTADPDGTFDATSTVALPANDSENLDQDFGYQPKGEIGDYIFYDVDGDGIQDPADTGIPGVTVTLSGVDVNDNPVNLTTITGPGGSYLFDNLVAGDYIVTVDPGTLPPTLTQSADPDNVNDNTSNVTLPSNTASILDQDFGYWPDAQVGDTIYYDIDGNGVQGPGEPGIPGVTVFLEGSDEQGRPIFYEATTGPDGEYGFDVIGGDYTVRVKTDTLPGAMPNTGDPDGGNDAQTGLNIANGQSNLDQDLGFQPQGAIGDTIFYDLDGDGLQDSGEAGVPSVTVQLTPPSGVDLGNGPGVPITTLSGSNGDYRFENLPPGDYTVTVLDPPAGTLSTADPDGGFDNTSVVTLDRADEQDLDQDFGYQPQGAIGDTIFYDIDASGVQDGSEVGIPGVTVQLFEIDGVTPVLDSNGNPVTDVTDGDGIYGFEHLLAGNYVVKVDEGSLPEPLPQTADPDGTFDATSTVALPANDSENLDQDFGYQPKGEIGDYIFYDVDGDGIQDPADTGIPGVTVTLSGVDVNDNPVNLTTITGPGGSYLFDNLVAGDYTVTVDPGTLPTDLTQSADPDNVNDNTSNVTLPSNTASILDQDFGYWPDAQVGDTIYYDIDGNGVQGPGEPGIPGVTVFLEGSDEQGRPIFYEATTGPDGEYGFDVIGGDYTVRVKTDTLPGAMPNTGDPDGGNDAQTGLNIANGQSNLDQDLGFQPQGAIGDTIFYDLDGDGVKDPEDLGIRDITVTLTPPTQVDLGNGPGQPVTTVTGPDGDYLFENLPPGDYTIAVSGLPTGLIQTVDPDQGFDSLSQVTLTGEEPTNLDQDHGYWPNARIGDTIYYDVDGDGMPDPGEPGIAGVTVILEGVDEQGREVQYETMTGPEGEYSFDVIGGDYTVRVKTDTLPVSDLPNTGDPDNGADSQSELTITNSETNLDQDFGYRPEGVIGDTIFYDLDGDGVQESGEAGISGVTVQLTPPPGVDLGNGPDVPITTITGPNGDYRFENLPPGDYTVTLPDPPAGTLATADPDGGFDNTSVVALDRANEVNLDQDFGYQPLGQIGDTVYLDLNGDGVKGVEEPGLPDIQIQLEADYDGDGRVDNILSTTTDSDGFYQFENLLPGIYTVTVQNPPANTGNTADPDGGADSSSTVWLSPPTMNVLNQDFGYQALGILITESFAVTAVDEDSVPNRIACYWVHLEGRPAGPVIVDISHDPSQIRLSKTSVTLTADNWNSRTGRDPSNKVCVFPRNDGVPDNTGSYCADKSNQMLGQPVPGKTVCGDHKTFIKHAISPQSSFPYDGSQIPLDQILFENTNGPDFDTDQSTVDVLLRNDDNVEVLITESFAISYVDEDGTPTPKACYWINLGSSPGQPVTIEIAADKEVRVDKASVTLDESNWNVLDATQRNMFNKVCIRAQDDRIVDATGAFCGEESDTVLGQPVPGDEVCRDHLGSVAHRIVTDDVRYGQPNVPFTRVNGPNLDGNDSTIDVLVGDDDRAGIDVRPSRLNVAEGGHADFKVALQSVPTNEVEIASEFGTLVFSPGNALQTQQLRVTVPEDDRAIGAQIRPVLLQVSSADHRYAGLPPQAIEVHMTDNDVPAVFLGTSTIDLAEDGGSAQYEVRLLYPPADDVRVRVNGGDDVMVAQSELVFTPTNWADPQDVTVTAVDDRVVEAGAGRRYVATIRHVADSNDSSYANILIGTVEATIVDNDTAAVQASDSPTEVTEGASAQYKITLGSMPTEEVVVSLASSDGVSLNRSSLLFTPENWQHEQDVQIAVVNDMVDNSPGSDVYTRLLLIRTGSRDTAYDQLRQEALVLVTDDDQAGLRLSSKRLEIDEGSEDVAYTIALTSRPVAEVMVLPLVDGSLLLDELGCPTDEEASSCLVFGPDNWDDAQIITVQVSDDEVREANQVHTIHHLVFSDDAAYAELAPRVVEVEVKDDNEDRTMIFMPVIHAR